MSSISKAGIFIDVKQLLEFTHRMVKEMDNADRRDYGSALIKYNLDMIAHFTMAYHRHEEKLAFSADGKSYEVTTQGEKRQWVDALEADFDSYCSLMEFLGYRVFKDRIHLKRRTINRAFRTAASQCRGTHNYIDAMNSYLEIIKATSDLKQGGHYWIASTESIS